MTNNEEKKPTESLKNKVASEAIEETEETIRLSRASEKISILSIDDSLESILEKAKDFLSEQNLDSMEGYDQKTDYHDLNLEQHTEEVVKKIEQLLSDEKFSHIDDRTKSLVSLVGKLHDLGKLSEKGRQANPKNPEKRQYVGHEKESERISREMLIRFFSVSEEEADFVAGLIALHAAAISVTNNFEKNDEPKGGELKSYQGFIDKVDSIPSNLSLFDKMNMVLVINQADIASCMNESSDLQSEKVKAIIARTKGSVEALGKLEKAMPALLEAVAKKKDGVDQAGIVRQGDSYVYNGAEKANKNKSEIPDELKRLGGVLRDKMRIVSEKFTILAGIKNEEELNKELDRIGLDVKQKVSLIEVLNNIK